MRRIYYVRRFRLDQVESDVLKILYELLIDREERHGLGEYYTPDWLAAKIVRHAVERPIEQRVLDPACGSGTFLFHAIRNFIKEAEEVGLGRGATRGRGDEPLAGMDIHPVAVIIARVTYLLALAPVIARRAGSLSIPVYLGDAMQLSTATTLHLKELVIRVPPPPEGTDLKFPEIFCKDIHLFDKLVARMRQGSEQKMTARQIESAFKLEIKRHYKRDLTKAEAEGVREMVATYVTFDELCRQGRDSVWTYVARNLSRPLALSFGAGWANVVVGNPPWVAFRHMSADLQKRFRDWPAASGSMWAANSRHKRPGRVIHGACGGSLPSLGRTHRFVLPFAALSRGQFERLPAAPSPMRRSPGTRRGRWTTMCSRCFLSRLALSFGRRRATARVFPTRYEHIPGNCPRAMRRYELHELPDGRGERATAAAEGNSEVGHPTEKAS